jgi:hypothetical protein
MNSNRLNNQVSPLLRKAKLKVAPLELPFVMSAGYFVKVTSSSVDALT